MTYYIALIIVFGRFNQDKVAAYGLTIPEIIQLIPSENVNISAITTEDHGDTSSIYLTLDINDMSQLTHLLSRVRSVRGVTSAIRNIHSRAAIKT